MREVLILAGLLAVVTAGACGSGGGASAVNAPAKCDALVDRLCDRLIICANDGTTMAECVAGAKTNLPCAQADRVSDGYNACMSELQSSPCSVLLSGMMLNLPATCRGAILFEQ